MEARAPSNQTDFQCSKCSKFFSQKSSLTRHAKRCLLDLPPPSRQKSCRSCAGAKVRCSLDRPICSRCVERNLECAYATTVSQRSHSSESDEDSPGETEALTNQSVVDATDYNIPAFEAMDIQVPGYHHLPPLSPALNMIAFPEGALPTIRDHGLISHYGTQTDAGVGPLLRHAMAHIVRVHMSWVGMMARKEHLPPIIHPQQLADGIPLEMMGVYLVARLWDNPTEENRSASVDHLCERELKALEYSTSDEKTLLGDFQAMLLYAIILLFPVNPSKRDVQLEQYVFNKLQDIAYRLATFGLTIDSERRGEIPTWHEWCMMAAKRRSIIALYQLGWAWSIRDNNPTFHANDLAILEAPAPKALWQAANEEEFRTAYIAWRRKWGSGWPYYFRELVDVQRKVHLDQRTTMWLEDADEFGVFVMSQVGAY